MNFYYFILKVKTFLLGLRSKLASPMILYGARPNPRRVMLTQTRMDLMFREYDLAISWLRQ